VLNEPIIALLTILDDSPFSDNEFLEKLFPNFWDFVVQLAAFVVLLVIVFFLGYKPVKKLLKARHDYVEHNLRDSEDAKAIAERNAKISAQNIETSKKEAVQIVSSAQVEANKESDAILAKAREDAMIERQKADRDILDAEKKAREDTRKQIVDVAIEASSQVLGREVDKRDNARLLDEFMEGLDSKEGGKK
jgi:F-type H+-transporting ATPase subunit b